MATIFLANGLVMAPTPRQPFGAAACLAPAPGVLLGRSPAPPSLFSAEHEIGRTDSGEWIKTADHTVVLSNAGKAGDHRFCLVVSHDGHAAAFQRAGGWLEKDLDTLLAAEEERRSALEKSLSAADAARPTAWPALESLIAALRFPLGPIPFRWSSSGDGFPLLDANATLALASAWALVDPEIAGDIVRSALACQLPDGDIPAYLDPHTDECSPHPAWPLLAQAAATAWSARQDSAFLDYVLPRLHRYLEWAIDHYDTGRNGAPCWRDREEAIEPAATEPGAISADLTAVLICEIEAFTRLCSASATPHAAAGHALTAYRGRLAAKLEEFLWDPAMRAFADRHPDGRHAATPGPHSVLPLLWTGLSAPCKEALLARMELERAPAEDPIAPSRHAAVNALQLEALRRSAPASRVAAFARTEFDAAARRLRSGDADETTPPPRPAAPDAAWIVLAAASASGRTAGAPQPRAMEWMDRHRTAVLQTTVGLAAAAVIAVGLAILVRRTMPLPSMQTLAALAEQQSAQGNYDQALEAYRQLLPGTRESATVELLLGNTYLKKGDAAAAEQCYRHVLEKSPDSIHAQLNLALALYRQGKKEEASRQYRRFLDVHGAQYPQLAARAQTALSLIEGDPGQLAQGANPASR